MRLVSLALACAITAGTTMRAAEPALDDPSTRLRPTQAIGRRLLAEGFAKSPTFRRLVTRLQRSDVIVYIRVRTDMPSAIGGSLRFVASSATDRFLMVSLNAENSGGMLIALLGHELQHAVEVADAPDVRSTVGLAALYRSTGVRMAVDAWDSKAAQQAGHVVRAEVLAAPGDTRLARHASAHDDEVLAGGSIASENR